MPARISLLLAVLLCAAPARAQETEPEAPKAKSVTYTPPSRIFSCELPSDWQGMEEEDALGPVARVIGPDDPSGNYRTGLTVRLFEHGQPGFVEVKKAVDLMRRSDKIVDRSATPVQPMRVAGLLARLFEVTEEWILPLERLPATEEAIHSYIAVIPSGSDYYVLRLSSARDVYMDFREDFFRCLRTFRPSGH
jgi:hypothetical protein